MSPGSIQLEAIGSSSPTPLLAITDAKQAHTSTVSPPTPLSSTSFPASSDTHAASDSKTLEGFKEEVKQVYALVTSTYLELSQLRTQCKTSETSLAAQTLKIDRLTGALRTAEESLVQATKERGIQQRADQGIIEGYARQCSRMVEAEREGAARKVEEARKWYDAAVRQMGEGVARDNARVLAEIKGMNEWYQKRIGELERMLQLEKGRTSHASMSSSMLEAGIKAATTREERMRVDLQRCQGERQRIADQLSAATNHSADLAECLGDVTSTNVTLKAQLTASETALADIKSTLETTLAERLALQRNEFDAVKAHGHSMATQELEESERELREEKARNESWVNAEVDLKRRLSLAADELAAAAHELERARAMVDVGQEEKEALNVEKDAAVKAASDARLDRDTAQTTIDQLHEQLFAETESKHQLEIAARLASAAKDLAEEAAMEAATQASMAKLVIDALRVERDAARSQADVQNVRGNVADPMEPGQVPDPTPLPRVMQELESARREIASLKKALETERINFGNFHRKFAPRDHTLEVPLAELHDTKSPKAIPPCSPTAGPPLNNSKRPIPSCPRADRGNATGSNRTERGVKRRISELEEEESYTRVGKRRLEHEDRGSVSGREQGFHNPANRSWDGCR